ncbi:hypothetical protein [Corallococcus exiguus]|uniref:hypothetical protein n=1 Tax=Corallococcus exiguus TaxID=83462 RepID=UPI0015DE2E7D|nr:hypothetical protein [Corallococcus exiguus]
MTGRTYASPAAFKQALERLRQEALKRNLPLERQRELLVFSRFLLVPRDLELEPMSPG